MDKRADIWAFGCVLYEMLTGKRAFEGEGLSDVMVAVLSKEPDEGALPAGTPASVRYTIEQCLDKDARQRLRDIGEARLILDGRRTAPAPQAGQARVQMKPAWQWIATGVIVGGLLVGLVGWTAGVGVRGDEPGEALRRFPLFIPSSQFQPPGQGGLVALSPDGQTPVYRVLDEGIFRLYQRELDGFQATPIPGTEGAGPEPFFSRDGQWLGFWSGNVLMKVALPSGRPVRVADVPEATRGASWGPDDTIVVGARTAGLLGVPAAGGDAVRLVAPDAGREFWYPQVVDDSGIVVFTDASGLGTDTGDVAVFDPDTGARRTLVERGSAGWVAPTGHLVFVRDGDLWAVRIDPHSLDVRGEPVPIEQGIRVEVGGAVQFAASVGGSLVYLPGTMPERTLVWVDREGQEERLSAPPRAYGYPRISPDGTRVALQIDDQEEDIWVWSIERETLTRVTFGDADEGFPVWTPDGRQIVASVIDDGAGDLFRVLADGTGVTERLTESPDFNLPYSFSPDGRYLVFVEGQLGSEDLWALDLDGERVESVVVTDAVDRNGEVSPDGRWLAYESNASGTFEIYVQPFPAGGDGVRQVSQGGGSMAVWARDGRSLFYLSGDTLMAAPAESGSTDAIGVPEVVLEGFGMGNPTVGTGRNFDVSPDGQRFLVVRQAQSSDGAPAVPGFIYVQNWFEELTRLVPTN